MFRAGGSCKLNILRAHFLLSIYWLAVHIQLNLQPDKLTCKSTQLIQILQHDTISFYSSISSKQNQEPRGDTLVRSAVSSLETSLLKAHLHKRQCLI